MRGGLEPRVVFDTNVLVSAFGFEGRIRRVWELVEAGRCHLYLSPFILVELSRNLAAKAGLTQAECEATERFILRFATLVEPARRVDIITRHEPDNRILECALEAKADILVTGNMRDLRRLGRFQGILIATPREFLDRFP